MNTTRTLIAAIALVATGAASAQEATYEYPQNFGATIVQADSDTWMQRQPRASIPLVTEYDRQANAPFVAQRSRAEVRAETLQAAAGGELLSANAETQGFDAGTTGTDASRVLAVAR